MKGLRRALMAGEWRVASAVIEDAAIRFVLRRPRAEELPPTARERRVLELAVEGWSNKAIGLTLGVPPSRVSESLGRVARKLGAPCWVVLLPLVAGLDRRPLARARRLR